MFLSLEYIKNYLKFSKIFYIIDLGSQQACKNSFQHFFQDGENFKYFLCTLNYHFPPLTRLQSVIKTQIHQPQPKTPTKHR